MTYSDDILQRYLDGALSAAQTAELEATIADDPELQRRLMALDPFAESVADAFRGVPDETRLERLRAAIPDEAPRPLPWRSGAAIAASLAVGVMIGSQLLPAPRSDTADWRMEVARYQALYVPETVAHLDPASPDLETELARAARALSLDLALPDLREISGLQLRRAQVLGFEGKPLIQLAYTDASGTPFALCIMPGEDRGYTEQAEELAGLATYSWANSSYRFLLVGDRDQSEIETMARRFKTGPLQTLRSL